MPAFKRKKPPKAGATETTAKLPPKSPQRSGLGPMAKASLGKQSEHARAEMESSLNKMQLKLQNLKTENYFERQRLLREMESITGVKEFRRDSYDSVKTIRKLAGEYRNHPPGSAEKKEAARKIHEMVSRGEISVKTLKRILEDNPVK